MSKVKPAAKRRYRMAARAEATAATRERILDAAEKAFDELLFDEMTLAAIAERAEVSVQTILRHFGTKDGLFVASLQHLGIKMVEDRGIAPPGDVKAIVDDLVDHYEKFGDRILRVLAQEEREPTLRVLADAGRSFHLEWSRRAFATDLKSLRGARRERRLAQFVAFTDIYMWKLLRRDHGLSSPQTKAAVREMIESLTEPSR